MAYFVGVLLLVVRLQAAAISLCLPEEQKGFTGAATIPRFTSIRYEATARSATNSESKGRSLCAGGGGVLVSVFFTLVLAAPRAHRRARSRTTAS